MITEFAREFFRKNIDITVAKNADYTGSDKNIFSNFTAVEEYGIKTVDGFITRMVDKLARINTYLAGKDYKVKTESIMDTLADLANYAMLLQGYLQGAENLEMHATRFYSACLLSIDKATTQLKPHLLDVSKATNATISLTKLANNCARLAYEIKDNNINRTQLR